jgi:hypothetical protein
MLDASVAVRVRDALFLQKYNLLLGAGVSLDSTDRRNAKLVGAEELRQQLCALTGARATSPLWRVAGLLTPDQVEANITARYLGCRAGPTVRELTRFPWKTAFTLNVDDALENAYETEPKRLQSLVPINYTREYETFTNPQELPLVHLHGSVRLAEERYVFSLQEYASLQRGINGWVHALSGLIVTEPFIIAGTALFEPDLEYFLAHRPSHSNVLARAPSILVEPYPDAGTRKDCARLNLTLVEATVIDFLEWVTNEFGPSPSPLALRQPAYQPRTLSAASSRAATAFWADFHFASAPIGDRPQAPTKATAFHFGRPPTWDDIALCLDVPLKDQLPVIDEARRWAASMEAGEIVCLSGHAGAGKTTSARRIATDLSAHRLQVFVVRATGGIDLESASEFLRTVADPFFIITDSLAEHGDQLIRLFNELQKIGKRVCIVGAERQYRMRLVRELLEDYPNKYFDIGRWRIEETTELIERYNGLGLVADPAAVQDARQFASKLSNETVSESVCRILNDFRPLRPIVRSLWNDTFSSGRPAYLAVAIAFYCHPVGARRDIVLAEWAPDLLAELALPDAPLRLVSHPDADDYLIPANATLATLLVEEMAKAMPARLLEIAAKLANALAPYVTRHTIKQRTPEARLAGRLFDADGVLPDLLREHYASFYDLTFERWSWNSRYWEQRALLISKHDIAMALQHARHAVAIERHPFPMTTLSQILFSASVSAKLLRQEYFDEALELMAETLRIEARWERGRTRKAYRAILDGALAYIRAGGTPLVRQTRFLSDTARDVLSLFPPGSDIHERGSELSGALGASGEG